MKQVYYTLQSTLGRESATIITRAPGAPGLMEKLNENYSDGKETIACMNCKWFGEEEEKVRQIDRHKVTLGPGLIASDIFVMWKLGLSRLSDEDEINYSIGNS